MGISLMDTFTTLDGNGNSFGPNCVYNSGYVPFNPNTMEASLTNSANLNGLLSRDLISVPGYLRYTITTAGAVAGPSWVNLQIFGTTPIMRVASTGVAGYTKVNGTGTILSWTAPNDGVTHLCQLVAQEVVTSGETGGAISYTCGASASANIFTGGKSAGTFLAPDSAVPTDLLVQPGQAVTVTQSNALTAGACKVFIDLWAN